MVILDPCVRLKTIQTQLVPAIISSAASDVDTLDIKAAIEKNLPDLKRNCYELLGRCEKNYPDCAKEVELCNREKIEDLFQDTKEKLEKIWEEKKAREEGSQEKGL